MQLKNRFKEEDKIRYWVDHQYCMLCGSNQGCALHHIDSCSQDYHRSIYNSAMLCSECHREADAHNTDSPLSLDFRRALRARTYERIEWIGRVRDHYDKEYLCHTTERSNQ